MKINHLFLFILALISIQLFSQETPEDWHLLDPDKDQVAGISLEDAYKLLKKNNIKPKPVIVAVLDSGLDIMHEDINPILWKNDDKPGNNKDDDGNGYIDDTNGWNFIGGSDGRSIEAETLEVTRLYKIYRDKFEGKNKFTISPEEKDEYDKFLAYRTAFMEGRAKLKSNIESSKEDYDFFKQLIPPLQSAVGKPLFTENELKRARIKDPKVDNLRQNYFRILERNKERGLTSEGLIEYYRELSTTMEELTTRLEFNYSLSFNGREIVGDNYEDVNERLYGNNDVTKRSEHGTHVSGIIGAVRDNNKGMNGIANRVIIMPIRNTPMGDETDKDVANGIRYAVDNGARIINMSFGKDFSPQKEAVDEAVKYAQENGVLLVHAAGNDGKNTDYYYNFPTGLLNDGAVASNWLEVGASSKNMDENLPASFSNYGKMSVDIFAPGVDIYATLPDNEYGRRSGTSMAAPVATGVAALLLSHFPELTPEQVIEIIVESGVSYDIEVIQPGSDEKVKFSELSKTGKVINARKAVELALEKYGKMKN